MNRDKARNWRNTPFDPSWLRPLADQRNIDLSKFGAWLTANLVAMDAENKRQAKRTLKAVRHEQKQRTAARYKRQRSAHENGWRSGREAVNG